MTHFDKTTRWLGWSKIEFSHSRSLQPTPMNREQARDGRFRRRSRLHCVTTRQVALARQARSACADDIIRPAWLSSGRSVWKKEMIML
jgi:hypothetical protein